MVVNSTAAFGAGFRGADDLGVNLAVCGLGKAKIAVFALNPEPATNERIFCGMVYDEGRIDFTAAHFSFLRGLPVASFCQTPSNGQGAAPGL